MTSTTNSKQLSTLVLPEQFDVNCAICEGSGLVDTGILEQPPYRKPCGKCSGKGREHRTVDMNPTQKTSMAYETTQIEHDVYQFLIFAHVDVRGMEHCLRKLSNHEILEAFRATLQKVVLGESDEKKLDEHPTMTLTCAYLDCTKQITFDVPDQIPSLYWCPEHTGGIQQEVRERE